MTITPPSRPDISRSTAEYWLRERGVSGPVILGRRGYYRDSMGKSGTNDRGIYDDAIVVITPTSFETFNANCDPNIHRFEIAVLTPGVWDYKIGIHGLSKPKNRQYRALVQAGEVTVVRDGGKRETGFFGINIHKGSYSNPSSEGCQTIYPDQWAEFLLLVEGQMKQLSLKTIRYVLTEREDA